MGLRTALLLTLAILAVIIAPGYFNDGKKIIDDALNIFPRVPSPEQKPDAQPPAPLSQIEASGPVASVTGQDKEHPPATEQTPSSSVIIVDWPEPEIDLFQEALSHYRAGRLDDGDAIAAKVKDPATRDTLEWIMIRTAGLGVDSARIESFARRNPDWPGASGLRRIIEAQYLQGRPATEEVLAFFARQEPVTIAGKITLSRALMQSGQKEESITLARSLWRTETLSPSARRTLFDTHGSLLTNTDHRIRLKNLLYNEEWEAAGEVAQRIGRDEGTLIDAFSAVTARKRNAAKMLESVPASLRTSPEWLLAKTRFERRAGNLKAASEALKQASAKINPQPLIPAPSDNTSADTAAIRVIAAPIPASPSSTQDDDNGGAHWALEQRLIARAFLDDKKPREAYEIAALPLATGESDRIEAAFFAGWIALRFLDEPEKAAKHFADAAPYATLPISIARVAYWRGRAAEALKDEAEAKDFFTQAAQHSTTYYGQLSRAKLGLGDVAVRPLPEPSSQARKDLSEMKTAQAVRLLFKASESELTLPFLSTLASQLDDDHLAALAELIEEAQDARAALTMGKAAGYRGKPFDVTAFPTFGIPDIGNSAIEEPMIYAITRQESAFNGKAVSHAGARGLMQLMPATAQATARSAGLPYDLTRLTTDPAYNAQLGASHLGELVDRWRGSYILAIASYNAGPGNVRKWIEAYGDPRSEQVDVIDWVERIPFAETRNYVQRVMENLQVYRHRLNKETALLIEQDMGRGRKTY